MTAAVDHGYQPSLRELVAEEVRVWLARRRISGAELARRLGRSQTFVAKRLDGRQAMDLDDLQAISDVLGIRVTDLFPATLSAATRGANREYRRDNGTRVATLRLVRGHGEGHARSVRVRSRDASGKAS